MAGPLQQLTTPVATHRGVAALLHSAGKDEWSSDEMNYADLDWSPDGRKWGKHRAGGDTSSSFVFHPSEFETYEGASQRMKSELGAKLEADYAGHEGRAF